MAMPQLLTQTSTTPDGQSQTRTTQFIPDPYTGALLTEIIEPSGDEATTEILDCGFDAHGVVFACSAQDASYTAGRRFSIQFDPVEDLYPTAVTNGLGQTTRFVYQPALGVLAATQDPNGVVEQWQYDGFGRLKKTLPPEGSGFAVSMARFQVGSALRSRRGTPMGSPLRPKRTRTAMS
jgi:YD repeat-containing protein